MTAKEITETKNKVGIMRMIRRTIYCSILASRQGIGGYGRGMSPAVVKAVMASHQNCHCCATQELGGLSSRASFAKRSQSCLETASQTALAVTVDKFLSLRMTPGGLAILAMTQWIHLSESRRFCEAGNFREGGSAAKPDRSRRPVRFRKGYFCLMKYCSGWVFFSVRSTQSDTAFSGTLRKLFLTTIPLWAN